MTNDSIFLWLICHFYIFFGGVSVQSFSTFYLVSILLFNYRFIHIKTFLNFLTMTAYVLEFIFNV